jgi:outer membrane lipoprotein-sorting protein
MLHTTRSAGAALITLTLALVLSGCGQKTTTPSSATPDPTTGAASQPAAVPTAELTADLSGTRGGQESVVKLSIKGDKSRMEATHAGSTQIQILRGDKSVYWILNPAEKTYIEMPAPNSKPFLSAELDESLAKLGERKLVGQETVNGYACDRYDFIYTDTSLGTMTQWVSPKLGIQIKMVSNSPNMPTSMELKNIKEGGVPDSLFELPSGYTKTDIPTRPGPGR